MQWIYCQSAIKMGGPLVKAQISTICGVHCSPLHSPPQKRYHSGVVQGGQCSPAGRGNVRGYGGEGVGRGTHSVGTHSRVRTRRAAVACGGGGGGGGGGEHGGHIACVAHLTSWWNGSVVLVRRYSTHTTMPRAVREHGVNCAWLGTGSGFYTACCTPLHGTTGSLAGLAGETRAVQHMSLLGADGLRDQVRASAFKEDKLPPSSTTGFTPYAPTAARANLPQTADRFVFVCLGLVYNHTLIHRAIQPNRIMGVF